MKPRVAMLAYACDPSGTGEHWLGWEWARTAARFCEVTLLAPPKARQAIHEAAPAAGITPEFVSLPLWLRWCSERLGSAGSWWRKIAWARRAARAIAHARSGFDIVHQTTFHTFRVPFYAADLGIPSVWGPIAGGESVPRGFDDFLGPAAAVEERRARQNERWLGWRHVQRSLRNTSALLVSNRTTLDFLPPYAREKAVIVPPNALRSGEQPRPQIHCSKHGSLRLIYAGNCVATRCMPLVFEAMREVVGVTLTIVGDGPAIAHWQEAVQRAGVAARVEFAGRLSRDCLLQSYARSDALIFPALRDSGGSALLEAMSIGLPVICLDWAGPGEMVDEQSGFKIAVQNPVQVIRDLAATLGRLRDNPPDAQRAATAAIQRAHDQFTWERKQEVIEQIYRRIRE